MTHPDTTQAAWVSNHGEREEEIATRPNSLNSQHLTLQPINLSALTLMDTHHPDEAHQVLRTSQLFSNPTCQNPISGRSSADRSRPSPASPYFLKQSLCSSAEVDLVGTDLRLFHVVTLYVAVLKRSTCVQARRRAVELPGCCASRNQEDDRPPATYAARTARGKSAISRIIIAKARGRAQPSQASP